MSSPYDFSNDDVSVQFHFTQIILCSNSYLKLTKYLFSIKTQHWYHYGISSPKECS